ncbi:MAG TPA: dTDP-4-dehydrorhamnose 3,5-epimerase [Allosphingosinicella sp.]
MLIEQTGLAQLLVLTPRFHRDERGFFTESFNSRAFAEATGADVQFVQDNHSRSSRGVLRGLHYQLPPHAQGKLVRVVSGEIFDVAVDLRADSPTFGRWFGTVLSAEKGNQLWIPAGFAHGFLTLSETADVLYKATDYYAPDCERTLAWNDPAIAIDWPLGVEPLLSAKDSAAPFLAQADTFPASPGALYLTRPYLPPLHELMPLLGEIWDSRILTNQGPFHQRFERELCEQLEVENVSLVANGMLALSAAIEAAGVGGEVITTPYSFVATTHAVRLGRLEPVFVDIRRSDLNIDPDLIEAAITPRTSAIVAVHCYGNPCDVEAIDAIATRHGLKVIYDAAHAFGVRRHGRCVCAQGDFAALSFHATKSFNTFEGGAVVAASEAGKRAVDSFRNFGIAGEVSIPLVGTNAKMSEFNAALGVLQLRHFEEVRGARRRVDSLYRDALAGIGGIECLAIPEGVEPNFSYFPIFVTPDFPISRDGLYERLKAEGVYARRYFYPLLSSLPMYGGLPSAAPANLPVATAAAEQILCLPIFPDLSDSDVDRVLSVIRRSARGAG